MATPGRREIRHDLQRRDRRQQPPRPQPPDQLTELMNFDPVNRYDHDQAEENPPNSHARRAVRALRVADVGRVSGVSAWGAFTRGPVWRPPPVARGPVSGPSRCEFME
jgi:hypothetical protein